jgi:hypothetical protein
MALVRVSSTTFNLLSTDGFYYPVQVTAIGGDLVGVEVLKAQPQGSGNDYVTMLSDDGLKYRWTLDTYTVDGTVFVENVFTLAADQNEEALGSFSLQYGANWWMIQMQSIDVEGITLQQLVFGPGSPFQQGGGSASGAAPSGRANIEWPTCRDRDGRRRDCPNETIVDMGRRVPPIVYVPLLTKATPPVTFIKI